MCLCFKQKMSLCLFGISMSCYLDDSDETFIANGVSGDGEATGRIPRYYSVHGIPRRSPRFIFVCHGDIRHYHIHTVLWDLAVELHREMERSIFSKDGLCETSV